jgi:hypothetical protein
MGGGACELSYSCSCRQLYITRSGKFISQNHLGNMAQNRDDILVVDLANNQAIACLSSQALETAAAYARVCLWVQQTSNDSSRLKTIWIVNLSALSVLHQKMTRRFIIVLAVVSGVLGLSKIATGYVNASPSLSRLNARAQHWINVHAIRFSGERHRVGHT